MNVTSDRGAYAKPRSRYAWGSLRNLAWQASQASQACSRGNGGRVSVDAPAFAFFPGAPCLCVRRRVVLCVYCTLRLFNWHRNGFGPNGLDLVPMVWICSYEFVAREGRREREPLKYLGWFPFLFVTFVPVPFHIFRVP